MSAHRPQLLVVDIDALKNELDSLRGDWTSRYVEARRRALRAQGHATDDESLNNEAEDAWTDAYPALELLRDEVR